MIYIYESYMRGGGGRGERERKRDKVGSILKQKQTGFSPKGERNLEGLLSPSPSKASTEKDKKERMNE